MANEARVSDRKLSDALGFERPTRVRELVARHRDEMASHGDVFHRSLRRNPANPSANKGLPQVAVNPGSKGGRPVVEYYLNEAQALLVCMFARTEKAAAIRKQVIEVFLAWRRGELVNAVAAPDPTVTILQRLEDRLTAMERAGRKLGELFVAPFESALSLTHAVDLWFDQTRARRPKFWGDVEVRGFLLATHRQATVDQVRERCAEAFGETRTPKRSAIHRFWQRLDRLKAENPSLRRH